MTDQPRSETYESSDFFADGISARPLVPGTVARGRLRDDEALATGRRNGELIADFPVAVDRALLQRGQERFAIFCTPCHDAAGTGQGVVVLRGFQPPPSFHIDRLRQAPVGYLFDVITRGFGTMPDYAAAIPAGDRWAVTSYVRALQLSQFAGPQDVPPEEMKKLEEQP